MLGIYLSADFPQHPSVFLVSGVFVQPEIYSGRADMVDIVRLLPVSVHIAVLSGHGISPMAHIFRGIAQVIALCDIHKGQEFKAGGIVPFQLPLTSVQPCCLRIAGHLGKHHPYRIWLCVPDEAEITAQPCFRPL